MVDVRTHFKPGKLYRLSQEWRKADDWVCLYIKPDPFSAVLNNIPFNSYVMFLGVETHATNANQWWWMFKVIYGEQVGWIACYHAETPTELLVEP